MVEINGIKKFMRSNIIALSRTNPRATTQPAKDLIRLGANENLYGCSPRVLRSLSKFRDLNIYPDSSQKELLELLAKYVGIGTEYIVATNGGEELIDLVIRLFVGPGDEVISCVPTFTVFRTRTQISGGSFVPVLRDENFGINVTAVKAAITRNTKLIILVNPNNPTGTLTPTEDILEIVKMGLPVLVDEAYTEYSGGTLTGLVSQYENLMLLRTLSKWAGLAGLRLGYGIAQPQVVDYLRQVRANFNINTMALIAVRESLKDIDYLQRNVKAIITERERLYSELQKFQFLKPLPSRGSFICAIVLRGNAKELQERLGNRGIRVLAVDLERNGISALRISVGKPEHTNALIKALQKLTADIVC